tara:strand:- start:5192 stop:6352 length:1161 start_codon:yes stop_codon:yes gene_type:complete
MTWNSFFICLFLFISSFNANGNEQANIDQRLTSLEEMIFSDPFLHDIKLRKDIERSIVQQEEFIRRIPLLEEELNKLDEEIKNQKKSEVDNKLEPRLNLLRKELIAYIDDAKKQHQENLKVINLASEKTYQSALTATDNANNRFNQYLSSQSVLLSIVGLFITFLAWYVNITLKRIDKTSLVSSQHLEQARASYKLVSTDIKSEKESLTILKNEIVSLHKMLDLRENYQTLLSRSFEKSSFFFKVKNQALELLNELLEIQHLPSTSYQKELSANLSYCNSLLGIISYKEDAFQDAYEYFVEAEKTNVHGHSDRLFNIACCASKIYQTSNKISHDHFDVVVDCFLKLSKYKGEIQKLRGDKDISEIVSEIEAALRAKGQVIIFAPEE